MLQAIETGRTPLQENLDRVGGVLARAAFVIVGIIVALGLLRGQDFIEMLIFGVALAVAVVPEALPAVVTISLAIGVQRMVKRNALMRRLPAVETLGSTSVICSDKTGTLTKDEMTVRKVHVAGQMFEVSGAGYEPHGHFSHNGGAGQPPDTLRQLLRGAALASDAHMSTTRARTAGTSRATPLRGAGRGRGQGGHGQGGARPHLSSPGRDSVYLRNEAHDNASQDAGGHRCFLQRRAGDYPR
jgi:Ca2+-transporting ATPase